MFSSWLDTTLDSTPLGRRFTWGLPAESIIADVFANCQKIFSFLICQWLIHHASCEAVRRKPRVANRRWRAASKNAH